MSTYIYLELLTEKASFEAHMRAEVERMEYEKKRDQERYESVSTSPDMID